MGFAKKNLVCVSMFVILLVHTNSVPADQKPKFEVTLNNQCF